MTTSSVCSAPGIRESFYLCADKAGVPSIALALRDEVEAAVRVWHDTYICSAGIGNRAVGDVDDEQRVAVPYPVRQGVGQRLLTKQIQFPFDRVELSHVAYW